MKLGLNLQPPNFFQTDLKFNNLMQIAGWNIPAGGTPSPGKSPDGVPIVVPGGNAATAIAATEGYARPGQYTLAWDGTGQVRVQPDMRLTDLTAEQQWATSQGSGSITFNLTDAMRDAHGNFTPPPPKDTVGRTMVGIARSDPNDPIRFFRMYGPATGADPTQLFTPDYIASLTGFDTFRFMEWFGTNQPANHNGIKNWANWSQQRGRDFSTAVDLCNATGANMWINIPHAAVSWSAQGAVLTDFCASLGAAVEQHLDEHLKVYVEYSNEVWNWAQPFAGQFGWLSNLNRQFGSTVGGNLLWAITKAAVDKIKEAAPTTAGRIKSVLAWQLGIPSSLSPLLAAAKKGGWKPDVIAGAPYPGGSGENWLRDAILIWNGGQKGDAIAMLAAGVRNDLAKSTVPCMLELTRLARQYGVEVATYETGIGLAPQWLLQDRKEMIEAFFRDPSTTQVATDVLDAMSGAGVGLCNWFMDSEFNNRWGARDNLDDIANPRWVALRSYLYRFGS